MKTYRKNHTQVILEIPSHREYVTLHNQEELIPGKVVIPVERLKSLIKELLPEASEAFLTDPEIHKMD